MYQSFGSGGGARIPLFGSARRPITASDNSPACAKAGDIALEAMTGIWSLRFGLFGCSDAETHGGTAFLGRRTLSGGDATFAYHGKWTLEGTEFTTLLHLIRHRMDGKLPEVFAGGHASNLLDCTAEAITPDHFEGRLRRAGLPDARLVMRRMLELRCTPATMPKSSGPAYRAGKNVPILFLSLAA